MLVAFLLVVIVILLVALFSKIHVATSNRTVIRDNQGTRTVIINGKLHKCPQGRCPTCESLDRASARMSAASAKMSAAGDEMSKAFDDVEIEQEK